MAKTLANYDPLVQIPSGMTPAGADFPIVESHDILVGENDKRLDAKLDDIDSAIGNVGQTPIATQLSSKVNTGDIVTSVAATGSTSNNKIPSETAVRAAIEAKTINVDSTVTEGSTNAVSGGAVHTQLATKQDALTFDTTPTASSSNPVTSGGVKAALDTKQDALTFDTTPTASSSNPVTSGGVKAALDNKQNTLTYETTPIVGSVNPVTSTGIRNAIDAAAAGNLGRMQAQYDEFVTDAGDVLEQAKSLSNGMVACSNIDAETTVGDTRILLYTGTTNSKYTNGHWYYNSAPSNQAPSWTDGGAVGSAPTIDNTLTVEGAAANSKAVGDAIENIVTISNTQPGSNSGNKVWIRETTDEEVQVPTYAEHIAKANKADIATNNESDNGSGTISASKAYAIGDHFYINNTNTSSENYGVSTLYKATAAIASGDAIVVGTNCEASKVADEITSLSNDLDNAKDDLTSATETLAGKNIFNKDDYNFVKAGINSSTNKLAGNESLRTIYVPVDPDTTYTVSKIQSARFIVGFTDSDTIANGTDVTGVVYNNNATALTSTSGSASKYILVTCYVATETTAFDDILATLQIEKGSIATAYEAYSQTVTAKDVIARADISDTNEKVAVLNGKIDNIVEDACGKNLFNKDDYNFINANINTTTNKLVANESLKTVYVKAKPNTTYTVSKIKSARFIIGFTNADVVANGIDLTNVVYNNAATFLTSTSGQDSKYILVLCYLTTETETLESILASMQIEEGSIPTQYEAFTEKLSAIDAVARDGLDAVGANIENLQNNNPLIEDINFTSIFNSLADSYLDDFYARESFIDASHEYTRFGADVAPTMTTGQGIKIEGSSEVAIFTRTFDTFPFIFTVGHIQNVKMGVALYVRNAPILRYDLITIEKDGVVKFNGTWLGYIDDMTDWVLFKVIETGVVLYDDCGNRIDVPSVHVKGLPSNYGLYFGDDSVTYGYATLVEWAYKPLDSFDVNRSVLLKNTTHPNRAMGTMRYSRSYIENGVRKTQLDPGDNYIKVLNASDNDSVIAYTNNPILRFIMDWSDVNTYRSEAGFRTDLVHDGKLLRHKFKADFMIPEADNQENPVGSSFATDIIQVHDNNFSADGWPDPPPVTIYYQNGKLYANVRYIATGEVPTNQSQVISTEYYLCDIPYDEWFTLEYEVRVSYLSGLVPHLVIKINGVEKLCIYTPIGYNIIQSGGYTRVTFGLYAPGLAYGTYEHTRRMLYATNVKYNY